MQKRNFEEQLAQITEREASSKLFKSAHKPSLTKVKGRYLATCICGWVVDGKFDTAEDALAAYRQHTGVIEKGRG